MGSLWLYYTSGKALVGSSSWSSFRRRQLRVLDRVGGQPH